jgi:GNAT superfamily N-acetyltransferase
MGREFPILLGPENLGNQYIFRAGGRVVSHVGVLRQTMVTCGVEIPVACVGAVCTDPEYRKAGLAGQLMDLAIQRSLDTGDVLMPISGNRTLYTRRGATSLGPQIRFVVPIARQMAEGGKFAVRTYEPMDWAELASLQVCEPVRYLWGDREPRLLEAIRQFGGVCLVADRDDGEAAAALVFCINHPMYGGEGGSARVVQFVGDLRAIPALLGAAAARHRLTSMDWTVLTTVRPAVARALLGLGAAGKPQMAGWTVLILNLAKLVDTIGPIAARAGVELSAKDAKLTVAAQGASVTLAEPETQVEVLFRGAATWGRVPGEMPRELRIACGAALPIPLPDYGINYV